MSTKPLSTRRIFFGHAGAALSAPLTVAATLAAAGQGADAEGVSARLAALEDQNAIRALLKTYVRLVNTGAHEEIATLFADPAAALVDANVRRVSADGFGEHDVIDVRPAAGTAAARLLCTVETETPIGPSCTLVQMARIQGEGVLKKSERRVLESAYVKQHGRWKLTRAAYRPA